MEIVVSTPLQPTSFTLPLTNRQALIIVPAVIVVDQELSRQPPSWAGSAPKLAERTYSIRMPEHPGKVPCARCGGRFQATGPTGHADQEPICDPCLLECERDLGLALGLVSVMRTYASASFSSVRDHWDALVEVGAIARVYEGVAGDRFGPARKFPVDYSR